MAAGTEATELSGARGFASVGAALLLLVYALRAPPKNWLLEYYPNPTLEGEAKTRAWVRRVDFEVPSDFLLSRVPDRPDFSVRFQSCLPVSDPTDLAIRMNADDRARLYVDGKLVFDSTRQPAGDSSQRGTNPRKEGGKKQVALQAGSHLITLEYTNADGSGALRLEMSQPGVKDRLLQSRLRRPSLDGRCDTT